MGVSTSALIFIWQLSVERLSSMKKYVFGLGTAQVTANNFFSLVNISCYLVRYFLPFNMASMFYVHKQM